MQAGINKRSFELNYNSGTIWCEHLDGIGPYEDEVIRKYMEDKAAFLRPSVSSSMIIDLDKTDVTEKIIETIMTVLSESEKMFRKIAFVGVDRCWRRKLAKIKENGCLINYFTDYEKAKEWVI